MEDGDGNGDFDGSALRGTAVDSEGAAGALGAGPHADEPESSLANLARRRQSFTIVPDREVNAAGGLAKADGDEGRARVAGDVGQGLLGDAEEVRLGLGETSVVAQE